MSLQYIGQVFNTGENTTELRKILDIHNQVDHGQGAVCVDIDIGDVDAFAVKQGGNVHGFARLGIVNHDPKLIEREVKFSEAKPIACRRELETTPTAAV